MDDTHRKVPIEHAATNKVIQNLIRHYERIGGVPESIKRNHPEAAKYIEHQILVRKLKGESEN
jgi:hypothetical protein